MCSLPLDASWALFGSFLHELRVETQLRGAIAKSNRRFFSDVMRSTEFDDFGHDRILEVLTLEQPDSFGSRLVELCLGDDCFHIFGAQAREILPQFRERFLCVSLHLRSVD